MGRGKQQINPQKVGKACDCCHARKIRCNGEATCNQCLVLDLPCRYLNIPKKKGPKGPSGRIPKAIRNLGIQLNQPASSTSLTSLEISEHSTNILSPTLHRYQSPLDFHPSPLVSRETVQPYIDDFFKYKWTITPFIHNQTFEHLQENFLTSPKAYALVVSLCASMIAQINRDQYPTLSPGSPKAPLSPILSARSSDFFMNEAKRARMLFNFVVSPTLEDVQTSFFMYNAAHNANHYMEALYYIREATTLLELLRLHREITYSRLDDTTAEYSRRTFWVVFISERFIALQQHQGVNLRASIELPSQIPEESPFYVISGFIDLILLWRHIDVNFVETWNSPSKLESPASKDLVTRYELMQDSLAVAIIEKLEWSEAQRTDLLLTQQWLKIVIWQLCVAQGLISSSNQKDSMSFTYPVTVARDTAARNYQTAGLDPHGTGILEKIFDIGCCLVDVLQLNKSMQPARRPSNVDFGPRESLVQFLGLCGTVKWGSTRYLPLLESKIKEYSYTIPASSANTFGGSRRAAKEVPSESQPDIEPENVNALSNLGLDPQIWDIQAMNELNHFWLESLTDPMYLDVNQLSNWEFLSLL